MSQHNFAKPTTPQQEMAEAVRRAVGVLRKKGCQNTARQFCAEVRAKPCKSCAAADALEAAYAAEREHLNNALYEIGRLHEVAYPAAPTAVTPKMALAAMREFSAQKGESHDAMWDQLEQRERDELIGEWIAILECAALTASAGDAPTREDVEALPRFDCVEETQGMMSDHFMRRRPDGEYVEFDDVLALYARPTEGQTPTETPK